MNELIQMNGSLKRSNGLVRSVFVYIVHLLNSFFLSSTLTERVSAANERTSSQNKLKPTDKLREQNKFLN